MGRDCSQDQIVLVALRFEYSTAEKRGKGTSSLPAKHPNRPYHALVTTSPKRPPGVGGRFHDTHGTGTTTTPPGLPAEHQQALWQRRHTNNTLRRDDHPIGVLLQRREQCIIELREGELRRYQPPEVNQAS
jgi:hypothetical protein